MDTSHDELPSFNQEVAIHVPETEAHVLLSNKLNDLARLYQSNDYLNTAGNNLGILRYIDSNRKYLQDLGVLSLTDFLNKFAPHLERNQVQHLRYSINDYIQNSSGRIPEATKKQEIKDEDFVQLVDICGRLSNLPLRDIDRKLANTDSVHRESLIRLSNTLQKTRRSGKSLLAGLYHTTTGRSLEGIVEDRALVSGDQLLSRGREVLAGEGIMMIDNNGNPLFQNPTQVSFASYVERRYGLIDWFLPQNQLVSFGVNEAVYGGANGSNGVQFKSPFNLTDKSWHSIVCDWELLSSVQQFVERFGFNQPPIVLTSTEYELYTLFGSRAHPFGYYLSKNDRDEVIIDLGKIASVQHK